MFHFEIKPITKDRKTPTCKIDEFQLATMLRIFKSRNRELFKLLNDFYDKVVEYDNSQR